MPPDEEKEDLRWYEVTWTTTEGRSIVKAASTVEAKKIASDHADRVAGKDGYGVAKLADGRIIRHEWYDPDDQQPYITDVEQDTASEVEGADIEAELEPEEGG